MASVWVLYDDLDEEKGIFESREAAEAVIDPAVRGSDCYRLAEVELGEAERQDGELYGPIHDAVVDLETGEHPAEYSLGTAHGFRRPDMPDQGRVTLGRNRSDVSAESVISQESALATARRIRAEYLASGQPTREPTESVWLEGEIPGYSGQPFDRPIKVKPGVASFHVPILRPIGGFGLLVFRRTDRHTERGLAIFELAKEASGTAE